MAVQPIRNFNMQRLDNAAEFRQMMNYDRDAMLYFVKAGDNACNRLAPTIERLAGEYNGTTLMEIDMQRMQDVAQQFNLREAPTLIAMSQGKEISRLEKCNDERRLAAFFEQNGMRRERRAMNQRRQRFDLSGEWNEQRWPMQMDAPAASKPLMRQAGATSGARLSDAKAAARTAAAAPVAMKPGREQNMWNVVLFAPRTERQFNEMLQRNPDAILLLYTCGNNASECERIGFAIDAIGEKYPGATIIKLDTNVFKNVQQSYNISKVPVFVCMREGKLVEKIELGHLKRCDEMMARRRRFAKAHPRLAGERIAGKKLSVGGKLKRFWKQLRGKFIGRPGQQASLRFRRRNAKQQQQKKQ